KELSQLISSTIQEALKDEVLIPKVNYQEIVKKAPAKKIPAEQLAMDFREAGTPKTDLQFNPMTGEFFIKEVPVINVDNSVDSLSGKSVKLPIGEMNNQEVPSPTVFEEPDEKSND